jgi:hypothetical protein
MVSGRLVHSIEQHGDKIIGNVIARIEQDPEMAHMHAMFGSELRGWGQDLLQHMGQWLTTSSHENLEHRYERIGRVLCDEGAPLDQCLRALFLVREKVLDYVNEQALDKDVMALYEEEELERRLCRFFDLLAVHMAKGFERASKKAMAVGV